jgi:hypothetical protein
MIGRFILDLSQQRIIDPIYIRGLAAQPHNRTD